MSVHTPGPWRRGSLESYDGLTGRPHRYVYRGDGESVETRIRIEGGEGESGKVFDCDADAALIAAAPDLLAALEGLLDADADDLDKRGEFVAEFDAARAAIAKAKGGAR